MSDKVANIQVLVFAFKHQKSEREGIQSL